MIEECKRRAARRGWSELCGAAGLSEPEMLADELLLLLEGARVTAQSVGADGLGARLVRMGEAMIAAHAPKIDAMLKLRVDRCSLAVASATRLQRRAAIQI